MSCNLLVDPEHVLPGWVCCACRCYNGAQRDQCRNCEHPYCGPKYEITEHKTMTSLAGVVHENVITKIRKMSP